MLNKSALKSLCFRSYLYRFDATPDTAYISARSKNKKDMERPGQEWFEPRWSQYENYAQEMRAQGQRLTGGLSQVPPPQAPDRFNVSDPQAAYITHPNQAIYFNSQRGVRPLAMNLRITYLPLRDILVDERISPTTQTETGFHFGGTDLRMTRMRDDVRDTLSIRAFPEPDSTGDVTVTVRMMDGETLATEELFKERIRPNQCMSHDLEQLGLRVEVWPILGLNF